MPNIVVTGGAGFIGSHLVEELVEQNHTVTAVDNLSTGKLSNLESVKNQINFVNFDLRDLDKLKQIFKNQDCVFHLAAISSVQYSVEKPLEVHENNLTNTLRVLIAARDAGVKKIIFASSAAVYGDDPKLPKQETDLPKPLNAYALSKLAGEHYCQQFSDLYGLETVSLRFFNVFGPRQDPSSPYSGVISIFAKAMAEGKSPTIFGDGTQTRDFVYVKDVVNACVLAMDPGIKGVFNIATGKQTSLLQLVAALNSILKTNIKPKFEKAREGDIKYSVADITLAKRKLNYLPRMFFEQGLAKTMNQLRTQC